MPTLKSILVPVDFSDVAANAYVYALRLADRCEAAVFLFYAAPPMISSTGPGKVFNARAATAQQHAEANLIEFREAGLDKVVNDLIGVPDIRLMVGKGEIEAVAPDHLAESGADLVVIGSSGDRKPLSGLLGNNTTRLVDQVDIPVLVVPPTASYRAPARLCYATDLEHLDPFRVDELFDLFAPFEPTADFVYVDTPGGGDTEYGLNLLRGAYSHSGLEDRLTFTRLSGSDTVATLLDHADATAAVLIMNRPDRSWLERLLFHSNTQEALLKTDVPLLLLSGREKRQ